MQVVPTLLRKLETNWAYTYPVPGATIEDAGTGRPLPQFIPKATFADLEVGEAVLELEAHGRIERQPETMAIARLLVEACPGRVSKRFATAQGEFGWHPQSATLRLAQTLPRWTRFFHATLSWKRSTGFRLFNRTRRVRFIVPGNSMTLATHRGSGRQSPEFRVMGSSCPSAKPIRGGLCSANHVPIFIPTQNGSKCCAIPKRTALKCDARNRVFPDHLRFSARGY